MATVPGTPELSPDQLGGRPAIKVERPRKRSRSINIDRGKIAERIKKFYDQDNQDRTGEIDARIQRYAKYRMWTEGKNWPWEDATDFANPDMMSASMRLQDTLHNSVLAQRPPIKATAIKKNNKGSEEKIDALLDHQFFEEQQGEDIIGDLAEDFVNEGFFTAYIPWIEESRSVRQIKIYDPIPADLSVQQYLGAIVEGEFPGAQATPSPDGFDWKIEGNDGKRSKVSFFTTEDDQVEGEIDREVVVYNGPRVIRKDLQEVLHPIRCENLQIKGPSNPLGASHVILKDFPSIDEIQRLVKSGFYDLITKEEKDKLGLMTMDKQYQ